MLILRKLCLIILCLAANACSSEVASPVNDEAMPDARVKTQSGPLTGIIRGDVHLSDFYNYRGQLPKSSGILIQRESLADHQKVPGAAVNMRLLYSSTDGLDGETPVMVSGSLFLPQGTAPDGGWPLVAWTHGTVGIADICAPSWTGYKPFHEVYLKQWLD
ncbi:MAG: hypothetical protein P8P26_08595 [Porticoccaceae bacterium]|nr:hypothetical protein [Porticoccaceae bacterium]MDG1312100.1 hypothetical protein [Porticoccaceae bacterium]